MKGVINDDIIESKPLGARRRESILVIPFVKRLISFSGFTGSPNGKSPPVFVFSPTASHSQTVYLTPH